MIREIFKQIMIIPIEVSYLNKEFAPILHCPSLKNGPCDKIIDYVCIPWKFCHSKKLVIWKASRMGISSYASSNASLDKWSATTFLTHFLSLISILNSCERKIQLIKCALASFLERRYLRAACVDDGKRCNNPTLTPNGLDGISLVLLVCDVNIL